MIGVLFLMMMIVVLFTVSFVVVSYVIKGRVRKRYERLLNNFNRLRREYDMDFYAQEVLKDVMIGIDEGKRKLLIVRSIKGKFVWHLVNLDDVRYCNIQRVYRSINVGSVKGRRIESHLSRLLLEVVLKGSSGRIEIPFFVFGRNSLFEANDLKERANYWHSLILDAVRDEARLRA